MEGLLLYKLMILYMLDRTDYTMTNSLISGFIVGKDYTSVFNLHESLSELINDEFISTDTIRDTIHYKITSSGEEMVLSHVLMELHQLTLSLVCELKQLVLKHQHRIELNSLLTKHHQQRLLCQLHD